MTAKRIRALFGSGWRSCCSSASCVPAEQRAEQLRGSRDLIDRGESGSDVQSFSLAHSALPAVHSSEVLMLPRGSPWEQTRPRRREMCCILTLLFTRSPCLSHTENACVGFAISLLMLTISAMMVYGAITVSVHVWWAVPLPSSTPSFIHAVTQCACVPSYTVKR